MIEPTTSYKPSETLDASRNRTVDKRARFAANINKTSNVCGYPRSNETPAIRKNFLTQVADLQISLTAGETVYAGEYKIINGNVDPLGYLFSYDAEDSVILTVSSSKTNNVAMYHINETTQLDTNMKKFMRNFGNIKNASEWKVNMVGGQWLTGSGLGTKIKKLLQSEYNISPEWKKWSWSGCKVKSYAVLLNVQTGIPLCFEHNKQFTDNINKYMLQQLRDINNKNNSKLSEDRIETTPPYFSELSIDKGRDISERHAFNGVSYRLNSAGVGARERIDKFVREINKHQIEMLPNSRKELINKLKETFQQLELQNTVELHIDKSRPGHPEEGSSFSTRSTDISRNSTDRSGLHYRGSQSSDETKSTAISDKKTGQQPFHIALSSIFSRQKESFTAQQHKLAEKAINELASGRQHRSSHPMLVTRFSSSILSALEKEYPDTPLNKFYSRDLGDWEATGKGRGVWRVVSVHGSDNTLIIVGVFDNHQDPYRQW